jgi:uncharacterized protein YbjT (DUF2867 family)
MVLIRQLALLCALASAEARDTLLVTGATGRTGALVYHGLRRHHHDVRALVRNPEKARAVLNCTRCDESDGIFKGDVTAGSQGLEAAFRGVASVVILTSSFPVKLPNGSWVYPTGGSPREVDWVGCDAQVQSAVRAGVRRVVLVSSMGTTQPASFLDKLGGGYALFYKTQGELGLMSASASLNFTIVKPSGLVDDTADDRKLLVGRNDELARTGMMTVPRADVARVVIAALAMPAISGNLRFDLSSDPNGPTTTDFAQLFAEARALWSH